MKEYNHIAQVSKRWNEHENLARWDEEYKRNTYEGITLRARERHVLQYLDSLNLKKGSKVLELGYGAGVTSAKIYSRGFNIIGIDISSKLRDFAIMNCEKVKTTNNKAKFKFMVGNAEKLDFPDNSFDCVIGLGFLQYLERPDVCLKEVYRVLRHRGYFIITQRNMYSINNLFGPLKLMRAMVYLVTNSRYELPFQNTFLYKPALIFAKITSPFSDTTEKRRKKLIEYKRIGLIKKNAISYGRLRKMIEDAGLKISRYGGAGYLTKKTLLLFPKLTKKLDEYLQEKSNAHKIKGLYKFGHSIEFLAQKI